MTAVPQKARIDWVDTGRGVAISLVVLFHATNWLSAAGLPMQGWITANLVISAMRLPMFFTLSGLFAGKWVSAPWQQLWSVKLSLFAWVYGLWSGISTFTFMIGMNLQGARGNYFAQFRETLQLIWAPRFELWFVWALMLMFILIRLLRGVPVWAQLAVTAPISLIALSFDFGLNAGIEGVLKYFFFFLMGMHARSFYFWWASRVPRTLGALVILVAGALAIAGRFFGWSTDIPGYYFITCCAGALAGILLSRELSRFRTIARIGRETLPVYLTHTTVIMAVCWVVALAPAPWKSLGVGQVLPPLLALTAASACHRFSHVVGHHRLLRYLYEQPDWFALRRPAAAGAGEPDAA